MQDLLVVWTSERWKQEKFHHDRFSILSDIHQLRVCGKHLCICDHCLSNRTKWHFFNDELNKYSAIHSLQKENVKHPSSCVNGARLSK